MANTFIFSKEHLIILLLFSVFLYFCPRLTKNLLPYSYIVEKIICGLIVLEIVFEQVSIASMGGYNVATCLPIGISRFTAYICIAILIFKLSYTPSSPKASAMSPLLVSVPCLYLSHLTSSQISNRL